MEDKEGEEFKKRIRELVKNVEKKDEDSNVTEQDVIDAKNRVLQRIKRRTQEEKSRSERILATLTYWIKNLYKHRPERYQEEIDELYDLIYQQLKKPNLYLPNLDPNKPNPIEIADKGRVLRNMEKVLGEGEVNRFKEKYNLSKLIASVHKSKQRDPNSWWEKTKFRVPIVIGLSIWMIVFLVLAFSTLFGGETSFAQVMMNNLLLSGLIVGIPTVIIQIIVVYVFKVVKMKPKSSYDIGDINDYIKLRERFRSGNYEYKTIKSMKDIMEAYERGEKFVFTAITYQGEFLKWFCIIFMIAGLILGGILVTIFGSLNYPLDILVYMFLLVFSMFTGIGALIYIPSFLKSKMLPRSFFILAPEGIVYRRTWGDVMSYSWKELDFKAYSVKTTLYGPLFTKIELPGGPQLHIILPNGSRFRFKPHDYNLEEFGSDEKLNGNIISPIVLVIMAFKYYFDAAKSA